MSESLVSSVTFQDPLSIFLQPPQFYSELTSVLCWFAPSPPCSADITIYIFAVSNQPTAHFTLVGLWFSTLFSLAFEWLCSFWGLLQRIYKEKIIPELHWHFRGSRDWLYIWPYSWFERWICSLVIVWKVTWPHFCKIEMVLILHSCFFN